MTITVKGKSNSFTTIDKPLETCNSKSQGNNAPSKASKQIPSDFLSFFQHSVSIQHPRNHESNESTTKTTCKVENVVNLINKRPNRSDENTNTGSNEDFPLSCNFNVTKNQIFNCFPQVVHHYWSVNHYHRDHEAIRHN